MFGGHTENSFDAGCESCGAAAAPQTRSARIVEHPNYLGIVLMRPQLGHIVQCENVLSLSALELFPLRGAVAYDLVVAIEHSGTHAWGHYIAKIRSAGGNWTLYNDAAVTTCSGVDGSRVSLVVYRRRE